MRSDSTPNGATSPSTDEDRSRSAETDRSRAARRYNYARFRGEPILDGVDRGVRTGDDLPEGTLETLGGTPVALADLVADRPAVIEFGSITCPAFVDRIGEMDRLARRYDGAVDFYVVYVREAHPGRDYPSHRTSTEKRDDARDLIDAEHVDRPVLVDDLDGTVHRAFDALPNSAYVVGADGVVAYRADWTDPEELDGALTRLLDARGRGADGPTGDVENNFRSPGDLSPLTGIRVFRRAGPGSLRDFLRTLPRLAWHRLRLRRRQKDPPEEGKITLTPGSDDAGRLH